jgi:hypothetical protein
MFTAIREAGGSLSHVAEFVDAARQACRARIEYDRKSTPQNLRILTLALNQMQQLYNGRE